MAKTDELNSPVPEHGKFILRRRLVSGKGLGNAAAIRRNQAWHRQDEACQTVPLGLGDVHTAELGIALFHFNNGRESPGRIRPRICWLHLVADEMALYGRELTPGSISRQRQQLVDQAAIGAGLTCIGAALNRCLACHTS